MLVLDTRHLFTIGQSVEDQLLTKTLLLLPSVTRRYKLVNICCPSAYFRISGFDPDYVMNLKRLYRCCFFLALVSSTEDVERAGVGVALINVHHPQVNVKAAGASAMSTFRLMMNGL